jgi:hypothetical protein
MVWVKGGVLGNETMRVFQPSGQRRQCVGQSKHGGVEFACDMERRASELVGIVKNDSGAGGGGGVERMLKTWPAIVECAIGEGTVMRPNEPGAKSGS